MGADCALAPRRYDPISGLAADRTLVRIGPYLQPARFIGNRILRYRDHSRSMGKAPSSSIALAGISDSPAWCNRLTAFQMAPDASLLAQKFRVNDINDSTPANRLSAAIGDLEPPANSDLVGPGAKIKAVALTSGDSEAIDRSIDSLQLVDVGGAPVIPPFSIWGAHSIREGAISAWGSFEKWIPPISAFYLASPIQRDASKVGEVVSTMAQHFRYIWPM